MHIHEIISRSRRDFTAIYKCEHCGYQQRSYGYDDINFHINVIPNMECTKCGKKADTQSYEPLEPKYAPDEVV